MRALKAMPSFQLVVKLVMFTLGYLRIQNNIRQIRKRIIKIEHLLSNSLLLKYNNCCPTLQSSSGTKEVVHLWQSGSLAGLSGQLVLSLL